MGRTILWKLWIAMKVEQSLLSCWARGGEGGFRRIGQLIRGIMCLDMKGGVT